MSRKTNPRRRPATMADIEARLVWNTRAPILSAEEMERLDENRAD